MDEMLGHDGYGIRGIQHDGRETTQKLYESANTKYRFPESEPMHDFVNIASHDNFSCGVDVYGVLICNNPENNFFFFTIFKILEVQNCFETDTQNIYMPSKNKNSL